MPKLTPPVPNTAYEAYVTDAREAHALYTRMDTMTLRRLQLAFELDQKTETTPESIAFTAGRIALIVWVLRERD